MHDYYPPDEHDPPQCPECDGFADPDPEIRDLSAFDSEYSALLSAVYAIFHAVDQLEQVCEDLIDCNDARLMQARGDLSKAQDALAGLDR